MFELIVNSGLVGLVLLFIGATCVFLTIRALVRSHGEAARVDLGISRRALLFWGGLAVLLGFLGHTVGVFKALSVIVEAETVSAQDVSAALLASLSTVILGFLVLAIAGAGWLGLGVVEKRAQAS